MTGWQRLRTGLAFSIPGILLAIKAFNTEQGSIAERIGLSVLSSAFALLGFCVVLLVCIFVSSIVLGARTLTLPLIDNRIVGALMLASIVYIWIQNGRLEERQSVAECIDKAIASHQAEHGIVSWCYQKALD